MADRPYISRKARLWGTQCGLYIAERIYGGQTLRSSVRNGGKKVNRTPGSSCLSTGALVLVLDVSNSPAPMSTYCHQANRIVPDRAICHNPGQPPGVSNCAGV
jgi:hypothetical protein